MLAVRDDVELSTNALSSSGALFVAPVFRPAVHDVGLSVARVDRVAAAAPAESVAARAPRDRVVARAAGDVVVAVVAGEAVRTAAAYEAVGAVASSSASPTYGAPRAISVSSPPSPITIWNTVLLERRVSGPSVPKTRQSFVIRTAST